MKRVEKEEIEEMYNMLNHLHFITNKTNHVKMNVTDFLKDYKVKNKTILTPYLSESGVLSKNLGRGKCSWKWISPEKPSKMMSRRVVEGAALRHKKYQKRKALERKSNEIIASDKKISREEFEATIRMINKDTGMYTNEVSKLDDLDSHRKDSNTEPQQLMHDSLTNNNNENSPKVEFSILWGLFSYSNK